MIKKVEVVEDKTLRDPGEGGELISRPGNMVTEEVTRGQERKEGCEIIRRWQETDAKPVHVVVPAVAVENVDV